MVTFYDNVSDNVASVSIALEKAGYILNHLVNEYCSMEKPKLTVGMTKETKNGYWNMIPSQH